MAEGAMQRLQAPPQVAAVQTVAAPTVPPTGEQRAAQALAKDVMARLDKGESAKGIVAGLVKKGWEATAAQAYVQQSQAQLEQYRRSPAYRREMAAKNSRLMVAGLVWAGIGTVVTIGTFLSAASKPGGGTYIVAWGAILFGLVDFVRGFCGWLKYSGATTA